jgi:CCR4-NOT transcriptional complex subunit CAF120
MAEAGRRAYHDEGGPHIRSQSEFPQPGAARQSVWSQVLDPGRNPGPPPELSSNRDTFVQLDPPVMTKAFAPQGLLSAGLQDKQDRSAKRQEELARESGASLINVPNKPPPPQTGLLGAISAHERERKRDGGVGAALTEREREKRLAEEKQRRFDEQQRQQMNQLAQGGSMYGAQGYNPMMPNAMMMGMNPMMGVNPMMTGAPMNPMMTNPVGYPGMMTGYNPQHMFAAQQAAQAYQQAMMAYSVANSQAGGDGTGGMAQPMAQPMAPMMTGTNMAMFDPRMSMMSMPMMGAPMGTTMGGMGMPMGGTTMTQPLGMQMTGGSGFDGRMSPQDPNAGLLPPAQALGAGPGQFSSPNSSAGGRGSPLARPPTESIDSNARPSRQNSPRPL